MNKDQLRKALHSMNFSVVEARVAFRLAGAALSGPIETSVITGLSPNCIIMDDYIKQVEQEIINEFCLTPKQTGHPDYINQPTEENKYIMYKEFDCPQYANHPYGWYRKFDKPNGKRNLRSK